LSGEGQFLSFIEINKIIFDTSLIFAIIAINMTIIGLTSLAETKKIIGVDYGRFLVKKYRIIGRIKIYEFLILFAIINVSSLFFMFVQTYRFRVMHFGLLTISLVFAISSFFSSIIPENKRGKKQIYEDELLGLYFESDNFNHQEADVLTRMNGGSRSSKKLSSNIISYFDTYNSDSQLAFAEVFGAKSVIYDYSKKATKKLMKKYKISPYFYRKSSNGILDISYEYFQLFRSSEQQFKWTFEILRIFDGDRRDVSHFDIFRLYNFSRIVTHLNLFGNNEAIYRYKFLEDLSAFYHDAVRISREEFYLIEDKDHLKEIEIYTYRQLLTFMFSNDGEQRDATSIHKASMITKEIILHRKYKGILKTEELLKLMLDKALETNSDILKKLFTEILNQYYTEMKGKKIPTELREDRVRRYIEEYQKMVSNKNGVTVERLFA
jgi:hypothetical protein